jgi:hypothetical protein
MAGSMSVAGRDRPIQCAKLAVTCYRAVGVGLQETSRHAACNDQMEDIMRSLCLTDACKSLFWKLQV